MTSVRTTNPDHLDAPSSAPRDCSARLSLKPGSSTGAVDGAWWPRSTDPAIELAALIETVSAQRAPVLRIALNTPGWDSAPGRIQLASGRKVAVDWFQASGIHPVRIHGTDDQRIDLLIIPGDTTPTTAELALTTAANGQDPDITTTAGHHTAPVFPPTEIQATGR